MDELERKGMEAMVAQLKDEVRDLKSRLIEQDTLERQLRQAQKMEAIAVLSSGVAHDFNNILQGILSRIQLAFLEEGRESSNGFYREIKCAIDRGSELAKQFLAYGAKRDLNFTPLDINKNIKDIVKLIRRTFPKNIHIEIELSNNINKVNADVGQIDQILMNLCINARDAMPDGGKLILKTENVRMDQNGQHPTSDYTQIEYTLLTISDTGYGIHPNVKKNIFKPFFTTKENGKGTGLGLPMVYSIVKDHKGLIDFTSNVGEGTTFSIYIPALSSIEIESTMEDLSIKRETATGNEAILFVDDDEQLSMLGKAMLERFGYSVTIACNGKEALEIFSPNSFSLVILDLDLPGMGGIECLEAMLSINRETKVIAISGYSFDNSLGDALKLGARAFLGKPFGIDQLLDKVRSVLDNF